VWLALIVIVLMTAVTMLVLPARALPAASGPFPLTWPVARGAFHVHTTRSDGMGSMSEIAEEAARAGLQFVVFSDHGNGTRMPQAPSYHSGVLCIDGVEISTDGGHYVAIDMPQAPYPLAGDPRDVIDDVRRLGGFGIAAHPGSPKPALQWTSWDAPFDGLEWLNADSEWRDEFWGSLGRVLLTYAFRPVETLGGLLDRPESVLQQWGRLTRQRRVPALAGADAHARLGFRQSSEPYQDLVIARLPAYEVSFRAFANHAILSAPLTGNAAADAANVIGAMREGRVFTSVDSLGTLESFEAKAISGAGIARPGDYLDIRGPVAILAKIAAPQGTTLAVVRDGAMLYQVTGPELRLDVGSEPGAYRIEAYLPPSSSRRPSFPWVLSNPIYVGLRDEHQRLTEPTESRTATTRTPIATAAWRAESSEGSESALNVTALADGTPALAWRFTLAGGPKGEQFSAMRFPVEPGFATHDRLQLRAQSDVPRRLWAQLRAAGSQGERWGKTFYLDRGLSVVELVFEQFRPLGPVSSARPPLDRIDALLLVADTLNNDPGSTGTIQITDLWLAK
jgi:hypothetical protein